MITIKEAKQIIEDNIPGSSVEAIDLKESAGRVLAENIISPINSPLFDNSAMDGYAVRWTDIDGVLEEKEVTVSIIGESAAGIEYNGKSSEGSAIRISTGAKVPDGFDTVVPIEQVEADGDKLKILKVKKKGQHIRYAGEEFRQGDELLIKGTEINPPQIAMLASIGVTELLVYKKPVVTIITTGSELVPYDSDVKGSSIRDSNGIMLEKAVTQSGGRVERTVHVEDSLDKTIEAFEEAAAGSDVVLISGGVSVGPHDHVKSAADKVEFKELFWRVNQRPGKPFFFARKNNCLLFGLPGNPVSALMTYINFVHSAIGKIQGRENRPGTVLSRLSSTITNRSSRDTFFRIKFVDADKTLCDSVELQGSHMIMSLVDSDGFIELGGYEEVPANSIVKVILFPWS